MWKVPCYVSWGKYAEKNDYDHHDGDDGLRPEFQIILKGPLHPVPVEYEMNDGKKMSDRARTQCKSAQSYRLTPRTRFSFNSGGKRCSMTPVNITPMKLMKITISVQKFTFTFFIVLSYVTFFEQ